MSHRIREFEFLMNADYELRAGACNKYRPTSDPYYARKPVERVVIGTVRISKDGSLSTVEKK